MTDTMLLLKDEVVEIALVADNPGDWAFHCHVIYHMDQGMFRIFNVVDQAHAAHRDETGGDG